jgi:glucose-1-phosphate thymidylyltransferase
VLIITTPQDQLAYADLLGDGRQWGISIQYTVQPSPDGLAQAFLLGEDFIGGAPVCLILGDNIFYGAGLTTKLKRAAQRQDAASVFAYYVNDPERYGVVEFDAEGRAIGIEEKPDQPRSHYAVTGLYFYDNDVVSVAKGFVPLLEVSSKLPILIVTISRRARYKSKSWDKGTAWLDTGTHQSLLDAGNFIRVIEERQGLKVACLEEIAYRLGYIDAEQVLALAAPLTKSGYGVYLERLVSEGEFIFDGD